MAIRRFLPPLLAATALIACARDQPSTASTAIRSDSAGVTVVRNPMPPPREWVIDTQPLTVIRGIGDSARISEVAGLELLRDGTLLVGDNIENSVRVFDRAGHLLRTAVRNGDGPGETGSVAGIFVTSHDTIYVHDRQGSALLVLDPGARAVRKVSDLWFGPDSIRRHFSRSELLGVLDDGSIVTREVPHYIPPPGALPPDSYESIPQRIRDYLAVGFVYRRGMPGGNTSMEFGWLLADGTSRGASGWLGRKGVASVFGDYFYFARTDTLGYAVYASDGKLVRVATVHRPRTKLPFIPDSLLPPGVTRSNFTPPEYLDEVYDVIHDRDGYLWIASIVLGNWPEAHYVWFVFDNEGALRASLAVRDPFRVMAVRSDFVLGVFINESGEQDVQLRRLHRK